MRYSISLSYNGAGFCGWQIQPSDPSVQQTIEDALSKLLGQSTSLVGAGRTDTGVNAIGYVAHFDCENSVDCEQLRYKLNAILPQSIAVQEVAPVSPEFHARFDAKQREYTYYLHTMKDPFVVDYSYYCTFPLDFEAMNRAAALLAGTHDFSCFEKVGADNKTSICTVKEAGWHKYTPTVHCNDGEVYWLFRISADRFLRNMVRAIVGTLVEVGRGKRSVDDFASLILPADSPAIPSSQVSSSSGTASPADFPVSTSSQASPSCGTASPAASCSAVSPASSLAAPNRCRAGESAPGHALFLTSVLY